MNTLGEKESYPLLSPVVVFLDETGGAAAKTGEFIGQMIAVPGEIIIGINTGLKQGAPITGSADVLVTIMTDIASALGKLVGGMTGASSTMVAEITVVMNEVLPKLLGNAGAMIGDVVVGLIKMVESGFSTISGQGSTVMGSILGGKSPVGLSLAAIPSDQMKSLSDVLTNIYNKALMSGELPKKSDISSGITVLSLAPEDELQMLSIIQPILEETTKPVSGIQDTAKITSVETIERSFKLAPYDKTGRSIGNVYNRIENAKIESDVRKANKKAMESLSAYAGSRIGSIIGSLPF